MTAPDRDRWANGWTRVPAWVVLDHRLADGEIVTLHYVATRIFTDCGWFSLSVPEIARHRRKSERQVQRDLHALCDAGYLRSRMPRPGAAAEYSRGPSFETRPPETTKPGPTEHPVTPTSPVTATSPGDTGVTPRHPRHPVTPAAPGGDTGVTHHKKITTRERSDQKKRETPVTPTSPGDAPVTPSRSSSPVRLVPKLGDVERVHEHWLQTHAKDARINPLTPNRKAVIEARLRQFTADDLCTALTGAAKDDWITGKKDGAPKNELTRLLKSPEDVAAHIERADRARPVKRQRLGHAPVRPHDHYLGTDLIDLGWGDRDETPEQRASRKQALAAREARHHAYLVRKYGPDYDEPARGSWPVLPSYRRQPGDEEFDHGPVEGAHDEAAQ